MCAQKVTTAFFFILLHENMQISFSPGTGENEIFPKRGPGEGEDILQAPSRYPVRYRILRKIFMIKPTFFVVRRYPIFSITKFEFEYVDNLFSQISIILNRLPPTYDYVNNSCLWQTNSNSIFMIIKSLGRWMQNRNRNNNGYKRTSVEENAIMKLILFISVLWDTSRGCTVHCTVG